MSLGRCEGCDKPLLSEHIRTVDRFMCAECLAENRTQLVTPRIMPRLRARFTGVCPRCKERIGAGQGIGYDVQTRTTYCDSCAANLEAEWERERLPL